MALQIKHNTYNKFEGQIVSILGDGNCLFRAISYCLYNRKQKYFTTVRKDVVQYIVNNWDKFSPFITTTSNEDYKEYMLKNGTYGTFIELHAAVEIYNMTIRVYMANSSDVYTIGTANEEMIFCFLYTGDGNEGHYEVIESVNFEAMLVLGNSVRLKVKAEGKHKKRLLIGCKEDEVVDANAKRRRLVVRKNDVISVNNISKSKRGRPRVNASVKEKNAKYYEKKKKRMENLKTNFLYTGDGNEEHDSENNISKSTLSKRKRGRPRVNASVKEKNAKYYEKKKKRMENLETNESSTGNNRYNFKCNVLKNCNKCQHCGALLFWEETGRLKWCCGEGEIDKKLPKLLADFYLKPNFLSEARQYNNIFAFSALGVTHGFRKFDSGPSLVSIQGRIYHRIFDLSFGDVNSVNNSMLYIDDGRIRLNIAEKQNLDLTIVREITEYLEKVNPLISAYKQLGSEQAETAHIVFQHTTRKTHGPILGDPPRSEEVCGIIKTGTDVEPRKVMVWKKNNRRPQFIHFLNREYECLQYPLLFPHATVGWSPHMKNDVGKKISQQKYYRYLILSDPRFTNMSRLGQEYIVDMWCRVIDERLLYIRNNQSKFLRVASRSEIDETIAAQGEIVPGKIYLPSSFTYGPRYLQVKYQDGMAIVHRLGKPTYFVTVTCNPKWPEIVKNLNKYQTAVDRPDLTCRVFQLKLKKLIADLKAGKIFGKFVSMLYVIEYQKRGLPHAHIALKVKNSPDSTEEMDKFVFATIPDESNKELHKMVITHMVHGPCGIDKPNAPCTDKSYCTKGFPKPPLPNTCIDDRGYVHYKRPCKVNVQLKGGRIINDQWIVPYNPKLLMQLNCHCNVEIASSAKIIKYLFKYIHKGPDMAKVVITPDSTVQDEIEDYTAKRIISSSEAFWGIFEFDRSGRSPAVLPLPVHLPDKDMVIFEPGKEETALKKTVSKLNLYFLRPMTVECKNMTYLDFYETYIIENKRSNRTIYEFPHHKHFLSKRTRGECVCRMYWLSPTLGEVYYLRLLLSRFPAYSFEELRTVYNYQYETFQEAAYARGLLNDEKEYKEAILEASGFKTARGLRSLFFNLIMSGAPAAILWSEFKDLFSEDFLDQFGGNETRAFNSALLEIDCMLRHHGKSTVEVGLAGVEEDSDEVSREYLRWDKKKLEAYVKYWEPKLNDEQRSIYNSIISVILSGSNDNGGGNLKAYIDGPGGSGKTVVLNLIAAKLRHEGKIVLCVASTGIAALNYEGGSTAHSTFKIPVDHLDNKLVCNISNSSQRGKLIRETTVIIWDELPMTHKFIIEAVDRTLKDFTKNNSFFGNKNVLFAGDFRQIPPVIKNGNESEIITSTIKFSYCWKNIDKFQLTIPERSKNDLDFYKYLLKIGENKIEEFEFHGQKVIKLKKFDFVFTLKEIIDFVYPNNILNDFYKVSKRAILSATNKNIDEINEIVLKEKIKGDEFILYSADTMVIDKESNPDDQHMSTEILNSYKETGIPNHKIKIKIGALCILTRNLNFSEGLVNGTKVVINRICKFLLEVYKPDSPLKTHLIPRVIFKFTAGKQGCEVLRKQFPVRLAYALTINKSQGQTLDVVGIDLREHVFAHGQLYVALSRARKMRNICILSKESRLHDEALTTANIVYSPLL